MYLQMFRAFEDSLTNKTLPFFWESQLDLYERFSGNLFREMLGTVQAARKTLEAAASCRSSGLTQPLQNRVYAIFRKFILRIQCQHKHNPIVNFQVVADERQQLGALANGGGTVLEDEYVIPKIDELIPKPKEESKCTIL